MENGEVDPPPNQETVQHTPVSLPCQTTEVAIPLQDMAQVRCQRKRLNAIPHHVITWYRHDLISGWGGEVPRGGWVRVAVVPHDNNNDDTYMTHKAVPASTRSAGENKKNRLVCVQIQM